MKCIFFRSQNLCFWKRQPNSQSCNFMKPQKALLKGSDLNTHCKEINSLSSNILFNPSHFRLTRERRMQLSGWLRRQASVEQQAVGRRSFQALSGASRQPSGSCQGRDVVCVIINLHSDFLTVQEAFWQKPPFRSNNNSGVLLHVA